jgi:hypothetical protein
MRASAAAYLAQKRSQPLPIKDESVLRTLRKLPTRCWRYRVLDGPGCSRSCAFARFVVAGKRLDTVSGQACPVVAQRQSIASLPPLPATSHRRPSATSPGEPDCRRVRQHSRIASHSAHTAQPTSSEVLPLTGANTRFLRCTLSLRGRCEVRHTVPGLLHVSAGAPAAGGGATLPGGRQGRPGATAWPWSFGLDWPPRAHRSIGV